MNCDHCKNPATVHLIEMTKAGQKVEKHLCEEHARQEGIMVKVNQAPINELLEKFVMKHSGTTVSPTTLRCDRCGLTYEEFRKTGLLGCADCYTAFGSALMPLLERAHEGAGRHLGKVPAHAGASEVRQQRLRQLREELDRAVAAEQYERAATLRDKLSQVEAEKA
ncbi:MAG: hypothetical protein GC162_17340 [Planctomycetes bacterium]|nr:hypothetical protein [Planctomycetota bacterium]